MADHISLADFATREADAVLHELVPLAGLVAAALRAGNTRLYTARLADVQAVLDRLCVHRKEALIICMAAMLDHLGWQPGHQPAIHHGGGETPCTTPGADCRG